jgi:polar amino acid transport system permease protein
MKLEWNDPVLPWYRRYRFIVPAMAGILAVWVFLLPDTGPLNILGRILTTLLIILTATLTVVVLMDKTKTTVVQGFFAVLLIGELVFVLYAYSGADFEKMGHVFFNRRVMSGNWHLFIEGVLVTLQIAFFSILFGTILGMLLSVFRILHNRMITAFIVVYVNLLRAIPPIVIIFFIYYALPTLNIRLGPVTTGILSLTLIGSAYISEIFRAGIEAIHRTQLEAARSQGMTFFQTMRLVILPQAYRIVAPTLTGRWIGILKDTAYCSLIAVTEILKTGRILSTKYANPTPLLVTAVLFLAMVLPLTRYVGYLEYKRKRKLKL